MRPFLEALRAASLRSLSSCSSEEKGRARDKDPRRQRALTESRAPLGEIMDGMAEYFDTDVLLRR